MSINQHFLSYLANYVYSLDLADFLAISYFDSLHECAEEVNPVFDSSASITSSNVRSFCRKYLRIVSNHSLLMYMQTHAKRELELVCSDYLHDVRSELERLTKVKACV